MNTSGDGAVRMTYAGSLITCEAWECLRIKGPLYSNVGRGYVCTGVLERYHHETDERLS